MKKLKYSEVIVCPTMETMLKFAIESVEFHSRGLFEGSDSYVRVTKFKLDTKKDMITADIEVYANGGKTKIKDQRYSVAGLKTWIFALTGSHGKA